MISKACRRLIFATLTVSLSGLAACELAVDFDRTKVDGGDVDASLGDSSIDAPAVDDAPAFDGAADADAEAATPIVDAAPDVKDGSSDAPADAPDAG